MPIVAHHEARQPIEKSSPCESNGIFFVSLMSSEQPIDDFHFQSIQTLCAFIALCLPPDSCYLYRSVRDRQREEERKGENKFDRCIASVCVCDCCCLSVCVCVRASVCTDDVLYAFYWFLFSVVVPIALRMAVVFVSKGSHQHKCQNNSNQTRRVACNATADDDEWAWMWGGWQDLVAWRLPRCYRNEIFATTCGDGVIVISFLFSIRAVLMCFAR